MIPILFSLGPLNFYSYGAMIALGIIISIGLMEKRATKAPNLYGIQVPLVQEMVWVTVLTGFLGARIFYVLSNWDQYASHPWEILYVWQGGLIFYGGFFSSFLGLASYLKWKKIPVLKTLDFIFPYIFLTHAFGRLGCFLNGCCYGKICDLPWAVSFPHGPYDVHPTQIYEALYAFLCFFLLSKKLAKRCFDGQIICWYMMLYGVGRFCVEFFRDEPILWSYFTRNQWISLSIFVVGLFIQGAAICFKKSKGRPRL